MTFFYIVVAVALICIMAFTLDCLGKVETRDIVLITVIAVLWPVILPLLLATHCFNTLRDSGYKLPPVISKGLTKLNKLL